VEDLIGETNSSWDNRIGDSPIFLKSALMEAISGAPKTMPKNVRLGPDDLHGGNESKGAA
jgi:hypothetical protein